MVWALSAVVALLLVQLLFVVWNIRYLKRLPVFRTDRHAYANTDRLLLSVLIPARNEELNIGECLDAVLREVASLEQALPGASVELEVLVLDDRSTDATAQRVAQRAAAEPRLRLLAGQDLPEGWMGKSWACHQLTEHARGRWLLFLDADARLEPGSLLRICETAAHELRGMYTGFPRQNVRTPMERLVVPLMAFTIACHLPVRLVRHSPDPKFAAAHGAFILISRETYDATGGHAHFRRHLVDDVMLARAVKRASHPLHLLNVTDLVSMRMYRSAREVWLGYKKNIFPGMGRNHAVFAMIFLLYGGLYVFPFVLVTLYASQLLPVAEYPVQAGLALAAWLLAIIIKLIVDRVNRISLWISLFIPVSIFFLLLIMLDSWRTALFGQSYVWKGRRYS